MDLGVAHACDGEGWRCEGLECERASGTTGRFGRCPIRDWAFPSIFR